MHIKLAGFAELQKQLLEFGPKLAANEQRNATRAAAAVFRDAVKQRLNAGPKPISRTHTLETNMVVNKRRTDGQFMVRYGVRVKSAKKQQYGNTRANRRKRRVGKRFEVEGPAFYGRFLEFGTSKMNAHPFMRPSFGPNVNKALDVFKARMAKGIENAAKRR
jgi:HK97 gp10 family phage protein